MSIDDLNNELTEYINISEEREKQRDINSRMKFGEYIPDVAYVGPRIEKRQKREYPRLRDESGRLVTRLFLYNLPPNTTRSAIMSMFIKINGRPHVKNIISNAKRSIAWIECDTLF